jgi:cytochrome P450
VDGLLGADLVEDPYPFYAELRREAPVWRVPGTDAYLVSTWALVTEATGRVGEFSNHFRRGFFTNDDGSVGVLDLGTEGSPDVFAGADPPDHTLHRKVFFPRLVQKKMEALEDDVSRCADELLDAFLSHERADAAAQLANPLPARVIADLVIGFHDADPAEIQRWVFAGSHLIGGRITLGDMATVAEQAAGMLPFVVEQLDRALESPGADDVLSAAAAGVRDGVFTRDEAAFTLMVLAGAGSETTTSLIGTTIRILAERPDLQDELRRDPSRVPPYVEEVLRFESPFRFHPRMTTGPVELGGVTLPEGTLVALLWASANRDEAVFDAPDEIILDRPNIGVHTAFGRGVHHCVGAPLARLEARVVVTKLLEHTTGFMLDPEAQPRWVDSLWVRRNEHVPLVLERGRGPS